jgi:hypothetical protein
MPEPFTPEQEERIRELARELMQTPALVEAIREKLNQIGRQNSIFGPDDLARLSEGLKKIGNPPAHAE